MQAPNLPQEELGQHCCRGAGLAGDEVGHLGETVHDDVDGIKATGRAGQVDDEVHTDVVPASAWDGQRLQQLNGLLRARLVALALRAAAHVIRNLTARFVHQTGA